MAKQENEVIAIVDAYSLKTVLTSLTPKKALKSDELGSAGLQQRASEVISLSLIYLYGSSALLLATFFCKRNLQ